tara:strand:- start:29 stop:1273 length:1245 start_codon:yes stop_codon:yes gene_type:complete
MSLEKLQRLTDLVWDSFSGERLSGGVKSWNSFEGTVYEVFTGMALSDDNALYKAGERIERAAKKLERQTRSWRTAVNLSLEGHEMDIERWMSDLAKTRKMVISLLTSIQKAAKLIPAARATGEHISESLTDETVKEARVAGMKTIAALDTAIKAASALSRNSSKRAHTMPRTLTASDRSSMIRLASALPKGSVERRSLLAGLKKKAYTSRDDEKAPYEKGGFVYLDSTHTYTDEADAKKHADAMKGGKVKGVAGITVKRDGKKVTQSLKIKGDLASVKKQDEAIRERAFNLAFDHMSKMAAGKTAADITDKLYDAVRGKYHSFESGMRKTLDAYLARFGKGLLKLDFVMDQRKSYIDYYTDREGIYPEGVLHFIDKRDHQQRDRYAVEADIQKLGLYGSVSGGAGMWKISFGGK